MQISTDSLLSKFMDKNLDGIETHKVVLREIEVPFDVLKKIFSFVGDAKDKSKMPFVCKSWHDAYSEVPLAYYPTAIAVRDLIINTLPRWGKDALPEGEKLPTFFGGFIEGQFVFEQAKLGQELFISSLQSVEQKKEQKAEQEIEREVEQLKQLEQKVEALSIECPEPERDRLLFSFLPNNGETGETKSSVNFYDLAIYDEKLASGWRYAAIKSAVDRVNLSSRQLKKEMLDNA